MRLNHTSLFLLFAFSHASFANITSDLKTLPAKVIYGVDNRNDIYEINDTLVQELSKSVAVKVFDHRFSSIDNGQFNLYSYLLKDAFQGMCRDERFLHQLKIGECSGFLASPDTIITAGHCIESDKDCANHHWVFDYANYDQERTSFVFNNSQVYRCSQVINRIETEDDLDFAVIKLERKVLGRKPLKMRRIGKVNDDTVLTVLGFPLGIPLKITTGATIRDNSKFNYFTIDSDTYSGNSGSPVIDARTGLVEGIISRGDSDFDSAEDYSCYRSRVNNQKEGRGEDVIRTSRIKLH